MENLKVIFGEFLMKQHSIFGVRSFESWERRRQESSISRDERENFHLFAIKYFLLFDKETQNLKAKNASRHDQNDFFPFFSFTLRQPT
jgi:hypothetical protein